MTDLALTTASARLIPEGEKFSVETRIDGDLATAKYAVRVTKDDPRYEFRTVFDFSGCSREDLIALAMYDCKVRTAIRLRDHGAEMPSMAASYANISVLEDLINVSRVRGPVDPVGAFKRNAAKLGFTDEKIAEMLAAMPSS